MRHKFWAILTESVGQGYDEFILTNKDLTLSHQSNFYRVTITESQIQVTEVSPVSKQNWCLDFDKKHLLLDDAHVSEDFLHDFGLRLQKIALDCERNLCQIYAHSKDPPYAE